MIFSFIFFLTYLSVPKSSVYLCQADTKIGGFRKPYNLSKFSFYIYMVTFASTI